MNSKDKIFVTKPALPPLEEFIPLLERIWDNSILTNNGPFHQELEQRLSEFLEVPYLSLFANGTLALVTALQVLRITGEVITTPYSFIATTHSLWWNNIKPVFVDIEPDFCNIDSEKIEAAITPKTTAILPVHVYGNPCNVEKIQSIADIYGLKIIYDAAHAFDVKYKNRGICNFGDLSVLSFHATKVFNTMEGGAIVCHDSATKQRIDYLKNFGFAGETKIMAPGINSKMNEMQAALGLLQLKYHKSNIEKRKEIAFLYRKKLNGLKGISCMPIPNSCDSNHAYFPIFVNESDYGVSRDFLYNELQNNGIYCRRYFFPIISSFSMYRSLESANSKNLPVAGKKTTEVLCLPIFPDLDKTDVEKICTIIKKIATN